MTQNKRFYLPSDLIDNSVVVHLVGVGGTGGEMLDNLVRLDKVLQELGHKGLDIHLFDHDVVSASNIGRTRFSEVDVGEYKVNVLAARYNAFYGMNIKANPVRYEPEKIWPYEGAPHLLITCTDSAAFRLKLGRYLDEVSDYSGIGQALLWLDLGNEKSTGQYVLGAYGDVSFELPSVYHLFGEQLERALANEKDEPTCSLLEAVEIQSLYINRMMATWASSLLYDLFKQGYIDHHGGMVSLEKGGYHRPLQINPRMWSFLKGKQAA